MRSTPDHKITDKLLDSNLVTESRKGLDLSQRRNLCNRMINRGLTQ
jgi:hypothetical protein